MIEILKCDKMEDKNLKHLWAYVGIPYSGKTTIAKTGEMPIVCPDTIRIALWEAHYWALVRKEWEEKIYKDNNE